MNQCFKNIQSMSDKVWIKKNEYIQYRILNVSIRLDRYKITLLSCYKNF